jgi:hypothetical protein
VNPHAALVQQNSAVTSPARHDLQPVFGRVAALSRRAGAWASYTTARSLSFVTCGTPGNRGLRDGVLQATIELSGSSTTYRFVAFSKTWTSVGTHTIKVVSVGTPVPRVDVDAFGVIR